MTARLDFLAIWSSTSPIPGPLAVGGDRELFEVHGWDLLGCPTHLPKWPPVASRDDAVDGTFPELSNVGSASN